MPSSRCSKCSVCVGPDGDDQDIDSQPRQFGPHRFAETVNRELAGRVFAFMRAAPPAQDRADVHHHRLRAFAQQRQRFANEFHGCEEVHFHDRPHASGIRVGESAVGGDARVVDQDIEPAELIAGCGECTLAIRRIGHVAGDANGTAAELRDLLRDFCEPIFAAREQDKIGAVAGQLDGECPADAAGCAGDQCAPIGESSLGH